MMDALAIEAAEAAVALRLPRPAPARCWSSSSTARRPRSSTSSPQVERLCREHGAFELRVAADPAERALIWKGRKSAFAAVGRISPDYIVQDGVIPRTALPEVLRAIAELSASSGVRVANVFHAGDGNLHPLVLFDDAVEPAPAKAAEEVSGAILDLCVCARRVDHRRARRRASTRPRYMPQDVHRRRPGHHAAGPLRVRPGRTSPTPARSSPPRGCAARCRAGASAPTRWSRPAWPSVLMSRLTAAIDLDAARTALGSACGDVADAGPADAVDGVPAGLVARPASTAEVAEVLRAAAAAGLAVVPAGPGHQALLGPAARAGRPRASTSAGMAASSTTPPAT